MRMTLIRLSFPVKKEYDEKRLTAKKVIRDINYCENTLDVLVWLVYKEN